MQINECLFRVVDVESTGLDPKVDKIVELGKCDVHNVGADPLERFLQTAASAWLCDPGIPIPPETKAIHHITDDMVSGQPRITDLLAEILPAATEDKTVYVAHNAPFDRAFLEAAGFPTGQRWLCTMRLAMHLWPEAPSFKNEVLRYWLGYDYLPWQGGTAGQFASAPHRAGHDAAVTALVLRELLKHCVSHHEIDELIAFADSPVVLQGKLGFGKHHDKTWAEVAQVDGGYLDWMLRQPAGDWSADRIHTAKHLRGKLL